MSSGVSIKSGPVSDAELTLVVDMLFNLYDTELTPGRALRPSREDVEKTVGLMISKGVLARAYVGDTLTGMVGGVPSLSPWSDSYTMLCELVLYVHPDYRSLGVGSALLSAWDEAGLPHACQTLALSPDNHDKGPILASKGYKKLETIWIKEN